MTRPDYSKQGYTDVSAALRNAILTITINPANHRPKEFAGALYQNLLHVFELCGSDDRVRAVILTADHTAPAYCSGGDISDGWDGLWDPESEKEGEHAHRDAGGTLSMAIYRCHKITIAAVNGHAAGIGMTALQLPFDFRFVWKDAKLVFPFIRRGIIPEATSTFLLPKLIHHSLATSLLLTARASTPSKSRALAALYHEILPTREAVYPAARKFALDMIKKSSAAGVGDVKVLLRHPGTSMEENYILESMVTRAAKGNAKEEGDPWGIAKRLLFRENSDGDGNIYPWWQTIDVRHHKTKL
ncbi:Enoyl-CoA hydratase AFT3-1 [Psilocybe cubensis]|nr:Enoyl-CoA hydratase AFT3-1 [Psilocybe cubensis]KAH9481720.1 Enoyl-CoA hydratase AFT3-1 [Psilocybe cubensis]